MSEFFNSPLLPVIVLIVWPAAKSIVFFCASMVSMLSRRPERREAAQKIVKMLTGRGSADQN